MATAKRTSMKTKLGTSRPAQPLNELLKENDIKEEIEEVVTEVEEVEVISKTEPVETTKKEVLLPESTDKRTVTKSNTAGLKASLGVTTDDEAVYAKQRRTYLVANYIEHAIKINSLMEGDTKSDILEKALLKYLGKETIETAKEYCRKNPKKVLKKDAYYTTKKKN